MVFIANLLLKTANKLSGRSVKAANKFLNMAKNAAAKDGGKMKIELPDGDGPITYSFEKTTNTDNEKLNSWDNYYANAGLFIRGYAEEIKINSEDLREEKLKLTEKATMAPVFKAHISRALWGFAQKGGRSDQMNYLIIGGIAVIIVMMLT